MTTILAVAFVVSFFVLAFAMNKVLAAPKSFPGVKVTFRDEKPEVIKAVKAPAANTEPVVQEEPVRKGKLGRVFGFFAAVSAKNPTKAKFFTRTGRMLTGHVVAVRDGYVWLRRHRLGPVFRRQLAQARAAA